MKSKPVRWLVLSSPLCVLFAHGPLAQAQESTPAAAQQTEEKAPAKAATDKDKKREVITVTGSRIRQIDVESATPVTTFSREQMEKSGAANVADFLRNSLPSAGLSTENETLTQSAGSASFGGRDFTADYTLVLLNGRRLPTNAIAADFVDLNLIPIAAVERVEYLTDGASAVYGSDAVAGVLNIITRKSYNGVSFRTRLGQSSRGDGQETSWQVVGGTSGDRGNLLLAADFFKREVVLAKDRPLIKSAVSPDGTDSRSPNGLPGYVIRADGTIEAFADCPPELLDARNRCQFDIGPIYEAIPKSERQNIYTVFDYDVSDAINFFGEARYSRAFTFNSNGAAPGGVDLAASSPVNPYGEDVTVVRRYLDFGPRRTDNTNEAFSLVGGLTGELFTDHRWTFEATSHKLRNLQVGAGGQINEPAVVDAFNSGVLDPFVFNTFDTAAKVDAYNAINTTTFREGTSQLQTYSLAFDGSLPVSVGAGNVGYAAGFEFRRENFLDRADNLSKGDKILGSASSDGKGDRENEGVYLELALPVLKGLDVSTAVRYDQIDHDKDATTYKMGVAYAPIDTLKLRGSFGTGFKAPNLHDLFLGTSFGVNDAVDVATCGDDEPCEINVISGGNRELEPEESTGFNLGVISQITPTLSLSVDYWDITIKNKVSELDLQNILNNEAQFGDLIVRDSNGRLNTSGAFVRTNLQNLTEETSAGVEVKTNYVERFAFGQVSGSLLLNKLVKSKTQETATDPLCDYSDNIKGLDAKATAGWGLDGVGAELGLRHYAERVTYTGGLTTGTCTQANPDSKFTVKPSNELDLQLSYVTPWTSELGLGVQNLTDAKPSYDKNIGWPWYSQQRYSNMGRYYYVTLSHEFQ